VYNPHGKKYLPGNAYSLLLCNNVLMYMEQFSKHKNREYYNLAFEHFGPQVEDDFWSPGTGVNNFAVDVARNKLPAVSWVMPPLGYDEHPPAPAALGEWFTAQILATLMSNPEVWARTVLFIMYDENDGWFDHVSPLTAPPGTPGEYVTAPLPASAGGVSGPIGLGVRVPMLVVSPFSKGGWVCSDRFDHTSQLQFVSERFNVPLPNVSSWRQGVVGNLTSALPRLSSPDTTIPTLPPTSQDKTKAPIVGECAPIQIAEIYGGSSVPVPADQSQPSQGENTLRPTPT
jgi:phospholipase C